MTNNKDNTRPEDRETKPTPPKDAHTKPDEKKQPHKPAHADYRNE